MEIKVKAYEGEDDNKSSQQREQEIVEQHEQKAAGEEAKAAENEPAEELPKEATEREVLDFMGKRYGRTIESLDEFNEAKKEAQEELPEDVSAYMNYKKETGRGIKDFYKLQEDFDDMPEDKLLREYLTATEKGLDADDISDLMEDYEYDEDIDEDRDIKKIKLSKKKTIAKAKDYFAGEKEKYKLPLESRREESLESSKDAEEYKQYIAEAKTAEEEQSRIREVFLQKTGDVFGDEFKGFEFNIDDNKLLFSTGDANELKKIHSDPTNFIKKYKSEDGSIQDAAGYHKSLAVAMNPDKFANFFYEQGKSAAADSQMRGLKNINMTTRSANETSTTKSGLQVKSVNPDHGSGLRIRSTNKK
jgi:hypothetical protein